MATEREYDEDEVRQILDLAVTLEQQAPQATVAAGGTPGRGREWERRGASWKTFRMGRPVTERGERRRATL